MQNALNSQEKVSQICKSKSTLIIIVCCILPFILIFVGFNTPAASQSFFWQNYQSYMVVSGLAGLLLSYWVILFRPNFVTKFIEKDTKKT
ncbi:hypothetical protein A9Q77_06005 [Marinomonas sp. 42_23_T18]|nr:hypothetical protein A9Q77_06005 [Marinomonas sp. 42_23_T18]